MYQSTRLGCTGTHKNTHTGAHQVNHLIWADQLLFPCHDGTLDGILHFRVQITDGGISVRRKPRYKESGEKFGFAVQANERSRSSDETVDASSFIYTMLFRQCHELSKYRLNSEIW